ncbi:DUF4397 domain-containing protein [Halolamina litorea]|jgi:hypothetical protein|uniref:DUF4397 domain-containing protein n=1 Tax=Halolamina litorea TaxID=1515593 RepID=A0ABD6BUY0_9EURY|nr:DUF4397 domain-containing protein [Halolamina litorea]
MSDPTDTPSESTDVSPPTRRRFVALTGSVVGTVLLAGCGGTGTDTDGSPNGTMATDGTGTSMDTETDEPMGTDTDTPAEGTETETEAPEETETETETPAGEAMVRVAHLSPDAPNVDVSVDGTAVLEDVPFGTVSDYLALSAGEHTVVVTPTGQPDTVVFEGEVTVEAEMAYTVAAIGEVASDADQPFSPLILEDDLEPPESGTARVRAVHASPDAPAVDITVGGGETVLFDGVAFGESGSVEVPAGDYTLEIRGDTESNDGEIVADFDVTVESEQVYTAFASGYLSPDDEPADVPFDLIVTQDTGSAE